MVVLKMRREIIKCIFIGLSIVLISVLSACDHSSSYTELRNERLHMLPIEDMGLEVTIIEAPSEILGDGFSFGLRPWIEQDLTFDYFNECPFTDERMEGCSGYFQLETPQDILSFSVANGLENDHSILVTLLYNYEAVAFRPLGSDEYVTELSFYLGAEQGVYIPFQLSESLEVSDYTSKLTAVFVKFPDYFRAMDPMQNIVEHPFGMILSFELDYYGSGIAREPIANFESTQRVEVRYPNFGLMITPDFEPSARETSMEFPPTLIQASPREEIALGFSARIDSYISVDLENYLITALLDWQQVEMSGLPYLLIDVAEEKIDNQVDHGRFTIVAPTEPGFYEFVLIGIPNPTHPNHAWSFEPASRSERITIEVVE